MDTVLFAHSEQQRHESRHVYGFFSFELEGCLVATHLDLLGVRIQPRCPGFFLCEPRFHVCCWTTAKTATQKLESAMLLANNALMTMTMPPQMQGLVVFNTPQSYLHCSAACATFFGVCVRSFIQMRICSPSSSARCSTRQLAPQEGMPRDLVHVSLITAEQPLQCASCTERERDAITGETMHTTLAT